MKYRALPIEHRLEKVLVDEGPAEVERLRTALVLETFRTEGFQAVTVVLRDIERGALAALRAGSGNTDRLVGRLQCIEEIRRSLSSLLPEAERSNVDWHDDEGEEFAFPDQSETIG